MIATKLFDGSFTLDNGLICAKFKKDETGSFGHQEVLFKRGQDWNSVLQSDSLLFFRGGGYAGLAGLTASSAQIQENSAEIGSLLLEGTFDSWVYRISLWLRKGSSCLEGKVTFKTRRNRVGWICYGLTLPAETDCWAYPWVMADRMRLPTNIGREIGVSRPNHIWAKLAGVPAITWRSGDCHGLLGFPLDYNYENSSLTCNPEVIDGKRLALGWGLARGHNIEDANEEYAMNREYSFPFQVIVGASGFEQLAQEWCFTNQFSFDVMPKYTVAETAAIYAEGHRHETYLGQLHYLSRRKHEKFVVSGYQSGSDDVRIIIDLLPRNACVDFKLYLETKDEMWLQRVMDQMSFLGQCQDSDGWFWENWCLNTNTFYFQGIEEFGPRIDRNAHCCEYIAKLVKLFQENGKTAPNEWLTLAKRCIAWIKQYVQPDGALPMTVVPERYTKTKVVGTSAGYTASTPGLARPEVTTRNSPSPQTRLLVSFLELARLLDDPTLDEVRRKHEAWVLEHAYARQEWWGHWNDTGHTATVFSTMKFIEYCVRAHELLGDDKYLKMASETASWAFFQHVPKQLEWCRQYTRGAVIEQDNYMQYGNDMGDNLIVQALVKLGASRKSNFFHDMALQSFVTTQMSLCDDKRHPWYGCWSTYVADSTGLTVPFDTDPSNGVATHYAISAGMWDLWNLPKDFVLKRID